MKYRLYTVHLGVFDYSSDIELTTENQLHWNFFFPQSFTYCRDVLEIVIS